MAIFIIAIFLYYLSSKITRTRTDPIITFSSIMMFFLLSCITIFLYIALLDLKSKFDVKHLYILVFTVAVVFVIYLTITINISIRRRKKIGYFENRLIDDYSRNKIIALLAGDNNENLLKETDEKLIEQLIYTVVDEAIVKHLKTLALKRAQLTFIDDYDIIDKSKWTAEKNKFITRVINPAVLDKFREISNSFEYMIPEFLKDEYCKQSCIQNIEEKTLNYSIENPSKTHINDIQDGYEYEEYVAKLLRQHGWNARVTKGSGDQGADIIANKDNTKAAVQCKFYTNPVGNQSVQEVFAAQAYYGCDKAYVITNSTFTPSAKQLANKSGVDLLHHSEIYKL